MNRTLLTGFRSALALAAVVPALAGNEYTGPCHIEIPNKKECVLLSLRTSTGDLFRFTWKDPKTEQETSAEHKHPFALDLPAGAKVRLDTTRPLGSEKKRLDFVLKGEGGAARGRFVASSWTVIDGMLLGGLDERYIRPVNFLNPMLEGTPFGTVIKVTDARVPANYDASPSKEELAQ